jgi:hypothetical protein
MGAFPYFRPSTSLYYCSSIVERISPRREELKVESRRLPVTRGEYRAQYKLYGDSREKIRAQQ